MNSKIRGRREKSIGGERERGEGIASVAWLSGGISSSSSSSSTSSSSSIPPVCLTNPIDEKGLHPDMPEPCCILVLSIIILNAQRCCKLASLVGLNIVTGICSKSRLCFLLSHPLQNLLLHKSEIQQQDDVKLFHCECFLQTWNRLTFFTRSPGIDRKKKQPPPPAPSLLHS